MHLVLVPIDVMTDCMDVWELLCGIKGLSNDKSQRLVVLGLREYRLLGIVRSVYHIQTSTMLADGLTKVGKFPQLYKFCTTGLVKYGNLQQKFLRLKSERVRIHIASEDQMAPEVQQL